MANIIPRRNSWFAWLAMVVIIVAGFLLFMPESTELLSIRPIYTVILFLALAGFCYAQPLPTPMPQAETGIEGTITISPTHGGPVRVGEEGSRHVRRSLGEVGRLGLPRQPASP